MSVELAKMKMMVANDIGATIEDRMEGERKTGHELLGASAALKQAAVKVPSELVAHLDRALEQGEIEDGMSALEVAQLVKKYLTRVGDFLSHLSDVEQQKAVAQAGRLAGIEDAMKLVRELRDQEEAKLRRVVEMIDKRGEDGLIEGARTAGEAAKHVHGDLATRRAKAALEKKSVDDMTEEELALYLEAQ